MSNVSNNIMNNLMVFNADKLDGFLITNSLVGLGLVIAIYALMSPVIKDLFVKRKNELNDLVKERNILYKKMKDNKDDTSLTTKYQKIQKQIKISSKIPLHLESGYQIPTVLFTYSITFSMLRMILNNSLVEKPMQMIGFFAFSFFVVGIILFVLFFLRLLLEIREYTSQEFQKIIEKEEKKEDKMEKSLKEISETLKKESKKMEKREKEKEQKEFIKETMKPFSEGWKQS